MRASERTKSVETASIEAATAYANANGYTDRTAVGLVLAGMAIAAACSEAARAEIAAAYRRTFPGTADRITGWAEYIDERSSDV